MSYLTANVSFHLFLMCFDYSVRFSLMYASNPLFNELPVASCGPLKVVGSNHSDGNHAGVTGDTVNVGCADGYSGSSTTVTCKAVAAGVSRWVGMPTCAGVCEPHIYATTNTCMTLSPMPCTLKKYTQKRCSFQSYS